MTAAEQRIAAALAQLGAEYEPPPGWEARVLASQPARRRPWWAWSAWWAYVMPAAAVAAALCVLQFRTAPGALAIGVDIEHRVALRGPDARVGDVVRVTVSGGAGERAMWVYRDELHLVARCPGDPVCAVSAAGIALALELRDVGSYSFIALAAGSAPPPPSGSYDEAVAAARRAGATIAEHRVTVR